MEQIIIDTLGTRSINSEGYIKAKGLPVKRVGGLTNIYYGVEDIDKSDFNKDFSFVINGINNNIKLLYVVNTHEYYTTVKRGALGKDKGFKGKEYTISSNSLKGFKDELKNFLITNGILSD